MPDGKRNELADGVNFRSSSDNAEQERAGGRTGFAQCSAGVALALTHHTPDNGA